MKALAIATLRRWRYPRQIWRPLFEAPVSLMMPQTLRHEIYVLISTEY
jgi:hypothetical protein